MPGICVSVSFPGRALNPLEAAVYKTLNGVHGLEGWRWLYIICGVITMPCGLIILFILPNYPSARSGKRWYLTDEEFELAQQRMIRVKRVQTTGLMNFTVLKGVFSRWHIYLLPLVYIFYGESVRTLLLRYSPETPSVPIIRVLWNMAEELGRVWQ